MRGKIDEPKNRGKTDRGNNYVTINYSDQRYKKPFQKLRNGYLHGRLKECLCDCLSRQTVN